MSEFRSLRRPDLTGLRPTVQNRWTSPLARLEESIDFYVGPSFWYDNFRLDVLGIDDLEIQ